MDVRRTRRTVLLSWNRLSHLYHYLDVVVRGRKQRVPAPVQGKVVCKMLRCYFFCAILRFNIVSLIIIFAENQAKNFLLSSSFLDFSFFQYTIHYTEFKIVIIILFDIFYSRRSPRGGKLPFTESTTNDGSRTAGMSGGTDNDGEKINVSSSTASTGSAIADTTATSSTSTVASTTISHVSLRANPFESFSVALDTERKFLEYLPFFSIFRLYSLVRSRNFEEQFDKHLFGGQLSSYENFLLIPVNSS